MTISIRATRIAANTALFLAAATLSLSAHAAAPVIASTASFQSGTNATSHAVTLPSGISSGDLLVMFCGYDGATTAGVGATGWTLRNSMTRTVNPSGFLLDRQADGSEGATVTVTTPDFDLACWTMRITGAELIATQAPEVPTYAQGSSATPDPPSVTPTGGPKDFLYLAVTVTRHYSNTLTHALGTVDQYQYDFGRIAVATNPSTATSSYDPAAFGGPGSSQDWVAQTVAIHPAAAGGGGLLLRRRRSN